MCHNDEVIFSTGTDEHGTKIQQAAAKSKSDLHGYCTEVSNKYKILSDTFDIGYSHFTRTTDASHEANVQDFWVKCKYHNVKLPVLRLAVFFASSF